jgi:isoleucyl-tRNA synthetase
LPIELKVLQNMKSEERQNLTPLTLRHKARDFALKAVDEQRQGFKRYGVWGDWEHPYLTLTPEYEAAQIGVFGQMVLKGYIYRGLKPVHWSPSSQTALAEAELEYPEGHTSRSLYAALE